MATYDRTELHVQRVEFHVPAGPPWGACWTDVMAAIHAATAELVAAGYLDQGKEPSADQIAVAPTDDAVIVSYEARTRIRERKDAV